MLRLELQWQTLTQDTEQRRQVMHRFDASFRCLGSFFVVLILLGGGIVHVDT